MSAEVNLSDAAIDIVKEVQKSVKDFIGQFPWILQQLNETIRMLKQENQILNEEIAALNGGKEVKPRPALNLSTGCLYLAELPKDVVQYYNEKYGLTDTLEDVMLPIYKKSALAKQAEIGIIYPNIPELEISELTAASALAQSTPKLSLLSTPPVQPSITSQVIPSTPSKLLTKLSGLKSSFTGSFKKTTKP
jgi:hypothetical protein